MSGITNNNDFLNQSNSEPSKNKRRTALQIEMDEYPEYYALNISQRNSLAASNYWRVMNGEPIIKVPLSDENYHKYFDKKCYSLKDAYQKQKGYIVIGKKLSDGEQNRINVASTEIIENKNNVENEIKQKEPEAKREEPKIEKPIQKIVPEKKAKPIKKAPENNNKQQESLF
jgi:hypothetical protein